jgi:hypothetical protein
MSAIRLMEGLRTNRSMSSSSFLHPDVGGDNQNNIQSAFNLYEKWWALPTSLGEKLNVDPLRGSIYTWQAY